MARPKGSYSKYTPKFLAHLRWQIEHLLALPEWNTEVAPRGKVNKSALARLLYEHFEDEYKSQGIDIEQLRQLLSGVYLRRKSITDQHKIEQQWHRAFFGFDEDDPS